MVAKNIFMASILMFMKAVMYFTSAAQRLRSTTLFRVGGIDEED
jgi:hypothetical protein